MLRMRGRRIAMDAAMMPVPGSAVAQIVAFIVIAGLQVSCGQTMWGSETYSVVL